MHLKCIKLAGFKSFVDPTTVDFPGRMNAVVGPNGCGKSNVIDAVRWVMGESSAKQLRGEHITDVIFSGSNTRKPTAQASVELVFDNSDGRIAGEYAGFAEIAIRRVVSRDSQSQYLLNGTKCRRKDIQDIFLGTGFGPRSYSIIEQGMINQLVEARPEDLRAYLEEAAGISRYKERRRETENRIRRTKENLDRLNDLREELDRQLHHLQRQARAAERFRELKGDERRVKAELFTLRWLGIVKTLTSLETGIRDLEVALEKAIAGQRAVDADIERSRSGQSELGERFNQVQGRFYQLGAEIARSEEAIQFREQRERQLKKDLADSQLRESRTADELAADEDLIRTLQGQLQELQPRIEAAEEMDGASSETLQEADTELRNWQEAWERFNIQAAEIRRRVDVEANRMESLSQVLQRLNSRAERLQEERAAAAMDPDEQLRLEELAVSAETGAMRVDELAEKILEIAGDASAAREQQRQLEQQMERARAELAALESRHASLTAVQEAALGRDADSAGEWLARHGLDGARLGERVQVASGWEGAAEAVLGDALQAVVVDDLAAVSGHLADFDDGRLAVFTAQGEAADAGVAQGETLAERVSGDINLSALLARVRVAEDLAAAMAMRPSLAADESVVTRDGIWLGANWLRVSRGEFGSRGILERAQELIGVAAKREQAAEQHDSLRETLASAREQVVELETAREQAQVERAEASRRQGEVRAEHGMLKVRMEELLARQERATSEGAEIQQQLTQEQRRLEEAQLEHRTAEAQQQDVESQRSRLQQERADAADKVQNSRRDAQSHRDRLHQLKLERQNVEARLTSLQNALERLARQREELAERRNQLQLGISDAAEPLPELKDKLKQLLDQRLDVENELAGVRHQVEAGEDHLRTQEQARSGAEQQVQEVRSQLERQRMEWQGLSVRGNTLREQITESGFDPDTVAGNLAEDANEARWDDELNRIGNRIQRLGAINLAAIDEYQQQNERKTYLDAQNDDLEQALATLEAAIKKIDKETRTRFHETFEKVNSGLQELFPKVFGGGHAYLEMTGEDLLDTGVTLMARPPGKRNSSIHLLSGGEKAMTAVALIFAIFRLNPSPVCMLDEVDAPLDDSNVARYTKLLREMCSEVQFIFITHNKITMEAAEVLMGVTMHEPGVSRLVAVDVEEAAALAMA